MSGGVGHSAVGYIVALTPGGRYRWSHLRLFTTGKCWIILQVWMPFAAIWAGFEPFGLLDFVRVRVKVRVFRVIFCINTKKRQHMDRETQGILKRL